MKPNFIFSFLLTFTILSQVVAQRPIEKSFTYEKYNLPAEKLEDFYAGRKYSVLVKFDYPSENDRQEIAFRSMVRKMLLESVSFPDMKKVEADHTKNEDFTKQVNEILVLVRFGQYADRSRDEQMNDDGSKYRFVIKYKKPVTIRWNYRTSPELNRSYKFVDGLDEKGNFVYKTQFLPEQKHYANAYGADSVANRRLIESVANHLKSKTDPYWPYTAEETVVFTTMKHKKMDFSRLDQGCDTAGEAVGMIGNEDIYANDAASAKLDEAIAIFEEVYQQYEDNKRVKVYPLLNILSCQLLQGNISGAYETVDRIKSLGGMFRMFVNTDLIDEQKALYDLHGVSYR